MRWAVLGMVLPRGRTTDQMMFFLQVFTVYNDMCLPILA